MTSNGNTQGSRLLISGFGVRVPDGAPQKSNLTSEDTATILPNCVAAVAEAVAYDPSPAVGMSSARTARITIEFAVPEDDLSLFECELSLTLNAMQPALAWLHRRGGAIALTAHTDTSGVEPVPPGKV